MDAASEGESLETQVIVYLRKDKSGRRILNNLKKLRSHSFFVICSVYCTTVGQCWPKVLNLSISDLLFQDPSSLQIRLRVQSQKNKATFQQHKVFVHEHR